MLGVVGPVEVAHDLLIGRLALLDEVQGIFHPCGEADVEDVRVVLHEECIDVPPQFGGHEGTGFHPHVAPVHDGGDRGGIGARPPDTLLLEFLDEARLGVAGRRLGEMLFRAHCGAGQAVTRGEGIGQGALFLIAVGIVQLQIPVEGHDGSCGTKRDIAGRYVHGGLIEGCAVHLGGDEPFPDEVVDGILVVVQVGSQCFGGVLKARRPDGLVRLLG